MTSCPCCGSEVSRPVIVSLETNVVSTSFGTVKLQPQLAVLLETLVRKFPGGARIDELGLAMWGQRFYDLGDSAMWVQISRARDAVKPIGLEIVSTTNSGYRIVMFNECDGDADTTS